MPQHNRPEASVDQLNQMQRYLGEEMIEDYHEGELTRRQMLRRLLAICGSAAAAAALMAACGESPSGASAPTAGAALPTTAPAAAVPTAAATAEATSAATSAATTAATEAATAAATGAATTEATTGATTGATAAGAATTGATSAATGATQPAANTSPLAVAADDPAVTGSDASFQSATAIAAYLARPAAEGTYPGVVVIHENRGLTDHIKDVARRLAKAGYIAIAPDLASRAGGTTQVGADKIQGYFANVKPDDLVADLNAAVDFLAQQTGVKADKYGVVGFCFGGAYTLRLAAANPKIAAAVPYYGVTPDPASIMSTTNAAILGQYGATDQRVDATIPALEQVMQQNGKTFEKHLYDGAGHAFNNDTGQSYNQTAALAAWQATLDWFNTYLKS